MPFYESVFIARQDVSTSQVDGLTDTFEKTIKNLGGSVTKKESWGLRTMAYRVKKNRKGHYVLMNIECRQAVLDELIAGFRFNDAVLRHLVIRRDEPVTEASPLAKGEDQESEGLQRSRSQDGPVDLPAEPSKSIERPSEGPAESDSESPSTSAEPLEQPAAGEVN